MSDRNRSILGLVVAIAVPVAAGLAGTIPMSSALPTWYRGLKKPSWNPPAWVFGPVWSTLYVLMGISVWLVAKLGWQRSDVRAATGLFAGQLALNALWTPIFFGLKRPGLALVEIVALWNLLLATVVSFFEIRPVAGALLLPYLLWTTFATVLNSTVWWMNRGES